MIDGLAVSWRAERMAASMASGVVAVVDPLHVPSVRDKSSRRVLSKHKIGSTRESDAVVVIQTDQLSQSEIAGQRSRFGPHTLHQIAVARHHVGEVVDH